MLPADRQTMDAMLAELAAMQHVQEAIEAWLWTHVRFAHSIGVSVDEIAGALNLSRATVYRNIAAGD